MKKRNFVRKVAFLFNFWCLFVDSNDIRTVEPFDAIEDDAGANIQGPQKCKYFLSVNSHIIKVLTMPKKQELSEICLEKVGNVRNFYQIVSDKCQGYY